ncbi:hypothetical protein ACRRTK_008243 [Alexandromys fortis]
MDTHELIREIRTSVVTSPLNTTFRTIVFMVEEGLIHLTPREPRTKTCHISVDEVSTAPPGFSDSPDLFIVKRLLDYIRFNVPSSDITIQAEDILSVLEVQASKKDKKAWDFGLFRVLTPEYPMWDASGMGDTLHPRQCFCGRAPGTSEHQKDRDLLNPTVSEPAGPEAGPVQLLTLEQPLCISADTLDVAAAVPTARQYFHLLWQVYKSTSTGTRMSLGPVVHMERQRRHIGSPCQYQRKPMKRLRMEDSHYLRKGNQRPAATTMDSTHQSGSASEINMFSRFHIFLVAQDSNTQRVVVLATFGDIGGTLDPTPLSIFPQGRQSNTGQLVAGHLSGRLDPLAVSEWDCILCHISVDEVSTTPPCFSDSPDLSIAKRLLNYVRLNVSSSDITIQAEGILSVLEVQEFKEGEEAWDFGLFRVPTPEYPMQDALGMGEILHLKPDFVAGPQRHLKPRKDTCLWTQRSLNQLCQKLDHCIVMLTSAYRVDVQQKCEWDMYKEDMTAHENPSGGSGTPASASAIAKPRPPREASRSKATLVKTLVLVTIVKLSVDTQQVLQNQVPLLSQERGKETQSTKIPRNHAGEEDQGF